jgi:dsDNA-specific endonuclease/ATPase MutS2
MKLSDEDLKIWKAVSSTVIPLGEPSPGFPKYEKIKTSKVLDLHNFSINDAYKILKEFLNDASSNNMKEVVIISGKGCIQNSIRRELPFWFDFSKNVKSFKNINDGSFSVKLS